MIIGGFQKFSLLDYPGKISCIVFTQGCNFNCVYCHNKELIGMGAVSAPKYMSNPLSANSTYINDIYRNIIPTENVLSFLKQRIDKIEAVVITGGEPTLQPDLIEFMKKIKKLGFLVKLDTNGSQPEVLKEVIRTKTADYIAMDVKAPFEKYSLITKTKVDIEKIKESINLVKNSGIKGEFRTTILKTLLSEEDIMKIQNLVSGDKPLMLQKFIPPEGMDKKFNEQLNYSSEEFLKLKENIKNSGCECFVR